MFKPQDYERNYKALFDQASDIIALTDLQGNIEDMNRSGCDFFGYKYNEIVGKHVEVFVEKEHLMKEPLTIPQLIEGEHLIRVRKVVKKNGQHAVLEVNSKRISNDHILLIARDITAIRQTEYNINERIKELACLYKISEIAANPNYSIQDVMKMSVEVIPAAWQYPAITSAAIMFDSSSYKSANFTESDWLQQANIVVNESEQGSIKVFYSTQMPDIDEGPFLKEERKLIDAIAGILATSAERKKALQKLKISEEKYRYLFDNSPAISIIWGLETLTILQVSNQAINAYGYSREEFIGMSVLQYRPKEDHEIILNFAKHMLHDNISKESRVWRHFKKNGEMMYMEISSHMMEYEGQRAILSLGKDITKQYVAEEQLKKSFEDIRILNQHLQTVREEERARIAREIHDELGQQLTALKMHFAFSTKKIKNHVEGFDKDIQEMNELIDETVQSVRRIAADLRPGVLDDLGLVAALEWQSQEVEKHSTIKFKMNFGQIKSDADKSIDTTVFRIYQEALTNIMRYAEATQVDVYFENSGQQIQLCIKDNGKGFDMDDVKNKKTLGLLGMKERALAFGGNLAIKSKPGEGTEITLSIPSYEYKSTTT